MNITPYDELDPSQRWSTVAPSISDGVFDPQGDVRFRIRQGDRIASAGSCFAIRIAQRLRERTTSYFDAELAPSWLDENAAAERGYRPFSARHGLIFTTLQLQQLFDRAFGTFDPIEAVWPHLGGFVDPFRPRISREPFASIDDLLADRKHHLLAVRRLFQNVDVFIFTMGLTELWEDQRDGAVFPFCPGLSGGTFDPSLHRYRNLTFSENYRAVAAFLERLHEVNRDARVILSISPVQIGATIEKQHVARSSMYTKSVLRAVSEEIVRAYNFVDYFASYEMVAPAFIAVDAYTEDRRRIRPDFANAVVDRFCAHYLSEDLINDSPVEIETPVNEPEGCDENVFLR